MWVSLVSQMYLHAHIYFDGWGHTIKNLSGGTHNKTKCRWDIQSYLIVDLLVSSKQDLMLMCMFCAMMKFSQLSFSHSCVYDQVI